MKKILILGMSMAFAAATFAQDIHFSQFYHSPLTANPANTGVFDGDWRAAANYRNQWRGVNSKPFVTISASYDMFLEPKSLKPGALGVGFLVFSDKAGTGEMANQTIMGSGTYLAKFGPLKDHNVSFGLQLGFVRKTIDYTSLYFGEQFQLEQGVGTWNGATTEAPDEAFSYIDVNLGVGWSHRFTEKIVGNSGIALYHINGPKETFYGDKTNKLNARFVWQGGIDYTINEKMVVSPGLRFMSQAKDQEINMGGILAYHMGEATANDIVLLGGVWARMSAGNGNTDALYPMAGARYKNWQGGLSWDVNVTSLQSSTKGVNGAPELAIIYIGTLPKPSFVKPVKPCTRF